ncbi:MAG TPA: maleylpyruvate isomerase N-terminal domain-containing protein [Acidimicrobiales bacterium]|nr:maleylpyruvate isomerase N-terminal domain-containing protein [Acidimicrobiales bacterium]
MRHKSLAEEAGAVVDAIAERTNAVVGALRSLSDSELTRPTALLGWSRLTIACHLRYGSAALTRMTADALRGAETSFYPAGRDRQRPLSLVPNAAEVPSAVVDSLALLSTELHDAWRRLSTADWSLAVREPADNPNLGVVSLAWLALARLTEVEVHGDDLQVGLPAWSETFVRVGLPARLERLNSRRTNHREVDDSVQGVWLLEPDGGPRYRLSVVDGTVRAEAVSDQADADVRISGAARDILAMLLGRHVRGELSVTGDASLAAGFSRAFPGP